MTTEQLTGFGNFFQSEAIPGALPQGQNSPQRVPFDLYAEQFSSSAFTAPKAENRRSWFYRLRPSVTQLDFEPYDDLPCLQTAAEVTPLPLRWDPLPYPEKAVDFIHGLQLWMHCGGVEHGTGAAVHLYAINKSMTRSFFYNADGELLIVPQAGGLHLRTEYGAFDIQPGEIGLLPRGVKCQVRLLTDKARGYVCENWGQGFCLPERGPIGANGLANERDFSAPKAAFEDEAGDFTLFVKFHNRAWRAAITHSPLDVVAWHGNSAPMHYALKHFNTMNSVSFDHPDPSIFTVLTAPTTQVGTANVDFVIFPERWMVAEGTFRPPYYHRNVMSEYMGLIQGEYDAKPGGFVPGGSSLHNCFSAHGPDKAAYTKAVQRELEPERYRNTLAFMFESSKIWQPSARAMSSTTRQKDYVRCWQGLKSQCVIK